MADKDSISVFEEERVPQFRQGEPRHELERILTAEDATNYVNAIERNNKVLSLKKFSAASWDRSEDFQPDANWDTADWFTALMGELGEAANFAKKIKRLEDSGGHLPIENVNEYNRLHDELEKELADTFCYLDLLATSLDINLEKAVISKWNEISERKGYPVKLEN